MRLLVVPHRKPPASCLATPADQPLVEGPRYPRRFELRNAWKTVMVVISTRVWLRLWPSPDRSLA